MSGSPSQRLLCSYGCPYQKQEHLSNTKLPTIWYPSHLKQQFETPLRGDVAYQQEQQFETPIRGDVAYQQEG